MEKKEEKSLSAREVIRDIRAGLDDAALMEKYKVTPRGLQSLFKKLVAAGALTQAEVDARRKQREDEFHEEIATNVPPQPGPVQGRQPEPGMVHPQYGAPGPPRSGPSDRKQCPHCAATVPEYATVCSNCCRSLVSRPSPPTYQQQLGPEEEYCPWEDRQNLGFFSALFKTIGGVLFSPNEFFARMPIKGGYGSPLLFAIIPPSIAACVSLLLILLLVLIVPTPSGPGFDPVVAFAAKAIASGTLIILLLVPVLQIAFAFIKAGIYHLCLYLFGGAQQDFEATFRVACYSEATAIWLLILSWPAYWICNMVCLILGLQQAHGTTRGKSAAAVLVPNLICFCGGIGLQMLGGIATSLAAR